MPKLPRDVKPSAAVKAFERLGYVKDRQSGSHLSMTKDGHPLLTIPQHPKALGPKLLGGLIKAAGISVEEFLDAL